MRSFIVVLFLLVAGPALMLVTGGCGSGGGGAPMGGGTVIAGPSNADFVGGYFWQLWAGNPAGPTNTSQWGIVTADGAGLVSSGLIAQNSAGVLVGPFASPPLPYSVDSNSRLEITIGGGTLAGAITEDGALAAVTQITPGLNPTLAILPRGEGVYNAASLDGEYHLCSFWWGGAGELSRWDGTVTFDGVGGAFNYSAGVNNNGAIIPPQPPMAWGAYAVGPAGVVTWNNPLAFMSGGIAFGGDLIVLSGTTQANDLQVMTILIKKGAGLGNATMSGTYNTVTLAASNAPPPRYQTTVGTMVVDGLGQMTIGDATANADGAVAQQPGGAVLPYTIDPDGSLSVIGGLLQGGVSANGRYAVVAGSTAGGIPQIWFMFR